MPTDIRVVHAHEFLQATPEGALDLAGSKEMLIEIALRSAPEDGYDIILDLRGTQMTLSIDDLWHFAAELHQYPGVFARKTAVIVPRDDFDHAGFFALCAQERGFQVSAFTSLGDAMEWLAEA
jgi:hypothetical protein